MLEGATTAEIDGRETRNYGVGEVVHVPPDVPHIGRNASATEPLKVLIIRIKDKSKPVHGAGQVTGTVSRHAVRAFA